MLDCENLVQISSSQWRESEKHFLVRTRYGATDSVNVLRCVRGQDTHVLEPAHEPTNQHKANNGS
jgi:hypothetical protein